MKDFKEYFSKRLSSIIKEQTTNKENALFVLNGISSYIDIDLFKEAIADPSTFNLEGNKEVYNNAWFSQIFTKINTTQSYLILSHQQYAYIIEIITPDFFKERTIIINDNLRSLFPISENDYIEDNSLDGLCTRSENLPQYQAEQFKIGNDFFYTLKKFDEKFNVINFFPNYKKIEENKDNGKITVHPKNGVI